MIKYCLIILLLDSTMAITFLFDRAICTGLGDRLGTMLTLAALAKLENARVVFRWCEDPVEVVPRLSTHIPEWHGYNYSLSYFKDRIGPLPEQIILVASILPEHRRLPLVRWANNEIPAEEGSDSVYTIAWRSTRLSVSTRRMTADRFQEAYRAVARKLALQHARPHSTPYVVLHLRGPDKNTFSPFEGAFEDPDLFCTGKVVRRLFKDRVRMIVMSNNASWANELLGKRLNLQVDQAASPFDDMSLLLGASAIVQHAWGGWSSYSTVPALAAGKPLITTFRGNPHRFGLFEQQGGLPVELFDCARMEGFFEAMNASLVEAWYFSALLPA